MVDPSVAFVGPLDSFVGPYIEHILFVLAIATMATRLIQHSRNEDEAEEDEADALTRHPVHWALMGLFVVASFYYTTLHHHGGIVLSSLVLGAFLTDFFEFEARRVEIREGHEFDKPKGAIVASLLVLLYAGYQSIFVYIQPFWNAII